MKDTSLKRLADYYKESNVQQVLDLIEQASKLLEEESLHSNEEEDVEIFEEVINKLKEASLTLAYRQIS
jgi:hypothetical protein